jgi:hypothetical protein
VILAARSLAPVVCGVCGRQAGASGYLVRIGKNEASLILWTCSRHVSLGKKVYDMKLPQLTQYENAAVTRAKEDAVKALMESILSLMWERGIKSLDEIDGPTFAGLEKIARMDRGVQAAFEKFLQQYAAYLDKVLNGEEPPF